MTTELMPQYDSRKSFYGKAQVGNPGNGDVTLISYSTWVAGIRDGKPYVKGLYSATTTRHIKEFLKQHGFKADTSKQFIIEEINGELAVTVLKEEYNIIEKTIYNPELAQSILNGIEEAQA